jgi:hypothetical protein
VDDEADQASLNTQVNDKAESETYAAISRLRAVAPANLYVQYTATPYENAGSKLQNAQELGVPVLDEDGFRRFLAGEAI